MRRLASDPEVPQRDVLLDPRRLLPHVDSALGTDGPLGVERLEPVRIKYRVGRGVGLVLRITTARGELLVSARSFPAGAGRSNYARALAGANSVAIGPETVAYAPDLETVFWTFPADRRIASLALLSGSNPDLTRLLGAHATPVLAAYAPEKAATACCVDEAGCPLAYVKVYSPTEADRPRLTVATHEALRHGPLQFPRVLGYDAELRALALEPMAGKPVFTAGDGTPPRLAGLGAALATLHSTPPPPELTPFSRLDPDRLERAAELIGRLRPDALTAATGIVRALGATPDADDDSVCLHGDVHGKNALVRDDGEVALVDLDQVALGPAAADLGSALASLRYLRATGSLSATSERALAGELLAGYRSVRELPPAYSLAWHTAAALLGERALRAVTRVRPRGLARLSQVLDAATRELPAGPGTGPVISLPRARRRRPALLLYCQHSVGLGHLTRSLALAGALAARFEVTVLSGGTVPRRVHVPAGVEIVALAPLGYEDGQGLVSRDRRRTLERAKALRVQALVEAVRTRRPAVVVVELFPFGRRAFTHEIVAMLDEASGQTGGPALVATSVRDILVSRGTEQSAYDERACRLANQYLDAILLHADPRFARLEESFRPRTPLSVPVHYTGFVTPPRPPSSPGDRQADRIVVSAGGGRVGEALLESAIEAHSRLWRSERLAMRMIAGPFLPEVAWRRLGVQASGHAGLTLRRSVGDLGAELRGARASISQCGYNTALDVLQARVPALVVPYHAPGEDEQSRRAHRLAELGLVRVLDPAQLSGARLAEAISAVMQDDPPQADLDLHGARASAELLWQMVSGRRGGRSEAAFA